MRARRYVIAAAVALGWAAPAAAQDDRVASAIAGGAVGERFDGYLGVRSEADPSLRKAVSAVNIRRRSLYTQLASRRGVTPQMAGLAAGCELLARVGVGQAYLLSDGQWRIRRADQGAPVPEHCRN